MKRLPHIVEQGLLKLRELFGCRGTFIHQQVVAQPADGISERNYVGVERRVFPRDFAGDQTDFGSTPGGSVFFAMGILGEQVAVMRAEQRELRRLIEDATANRRVP